MEACPACGSRRVYRSRTRSVFERIRRQVTTKRPFRCHNCNWRGWVAEAARLVTPRQPAKASPPPPDLSAVDSALDGPAKRDG
ncbi:MAG TPA: hypothetical protein PLE61_07535 [Vicinamibacterales bacterium]|nr:hypothetical protein [Vicinamibacterales bacterium]HPW20651.1 hypothetical protein [Vicinamibacterales bacterium]